MDLTYSKEDVAFREEVRTWLAENRPREKSPPLGPAQRDFLLAWQRKQYDHGWAGIAWPKEYGGRGLSLVEQVIWYEEYARAEAPSIGCLFVTVNHAGPTVITCGTEEQKKFHLPRILRGESVWCQGFSEPGSGSDLASLRTKGEVRGDKVVINGQKIWTSYAHLAQWQELLIRTDPNMSRHRGLTWIIGDMKAPGVTIRPIETMSGDMHFCEVFYDNVELPLASVVGEVGGGWRTAMATLSFERGTAFMEWQLELSMKVERLIDLAGRVRRPGGRTAIQDDSIATQLGLLRAEVAAMRAMTYMSVSRGLRQPMPGPEGTMLSLYFGELVKRVERCAMDMIGPYGLRRDDEWGAWAKDYLLSYRQTIAGGTSEIRRNIIGERVLGLPRDARGV